jgi:hypothetical protein
MHSSLSVCSACSPLWRSAPTSLPRRFSTSTPRLPFRHRLSRCREDLRIPPATVTALVASDTRTTVFRARIAQRPASPPGEFTPRNVPPNKPAPAGPRPSPNGTEETSCTWSKGTHNELRSQHGPHRLPHALRGWHVAGGLQPARSLSDCHGSPGIIPGLPQSRGSRASPV